MLTQAQVRKINAEFRAKDQSHLWPICGAFSVAERAIRRVRDLQRASGGCYVECVESYRETLERVAIDIVNNQRNW